MEVGGQKWGETGWKWGDFSLEWLMAVSSSSDSLPVNGMESAGFDRACFVFILAI